MGDEHQAAGVPAAHAHVETVSSYLNAHGVEHEIVEHEETWSAADDARASSVPADQAAKTIVLSDHGAYLLAVVPASERLDLHKLRELLGATRSLQLASEEEMSESFPEFEVGAVPPVAAMVVAGEIVDRDLLKSARILCGGGDHRHSILVDPRKLVELTGARVGDICED